MPDRLRRLQRITPQQLRAFEAVARLRSITQAARELHVTQPTVSVQMRELVEAIGEPLFEQVGRNIRPTQAGEALQRSCAELADCWLRFEARLGEIRGLLTGRLRIAAVTTAEYFVPDLLGPFAAAHPGVEMELAIENRDRIVQRLQRGEDDLAVMMLPPDDLPLQAAPFLDNPLVVIAAAAHPLAGQSLELADLAQQRWLMREAGSGTRMVTEQRFAKAGFAPRVAMSLGSNEAIKHAVAAGLGIAVISQLAVASALSHGLDDARLGLTVLDVSGFPIQRRWSVVWRNDQLLCAAARRFVDYLQAGLVETAPGTAVGQSSSSLGLVGQ